MYYSPEKRIGVKNFLRTLNSEVYVRRATVHRHDVDVVPEEKEKGEPRNDPESDE